MNQIRAFLIEQGITVRRSVAALRNSLEAILGGVCIWLILAMARARSTKAWNEVIVASQRSAGRCGGNA